MENRPNQEIFDAMSDCIHIIDRTFRVILVNKAYLNLTREAGYPENPLGKNLFEVYPFLGQKVRDEYQQVFTTGKTLKTEEMTTIHQTDFYTETQKIPLFEGTRVVQVMTIMRDISEWRRAEKFKNNLITIAAHELKTPLTAILGWTDYIKVLLDKGEDLNKRIEREDLFSIIRNAERLKTIIDNYLDVSRIEFGRLILSLEMIDISKLLRSAINSVAYLFKEKNIKLHVDIPNVNLYGDPFRLEQVFVNLLSNANNYSPPKTNVFVRGEDLGNKIKILIRDEFFGFRPHELKDVFQPFCASFIKAKGSKRFAGTGVGLYICRRIIEAHHGHIEIQSPGPDLGSTVTVTLLKDPREHIVSNKC